jgi:hypothetical protein
MDYNHEIRGPNGETWRIHETFEKNASKLMVNYLRKNTGRIALAGMHIRNPETGETIIPGIYGDSDWAKVKTLASNIGSEMAQTGAWSAADNSHAAGMVDFAHDLLHGRSPQEYTRLDAWLRLIRATGIPKMMNAGLFAHASEGTTTTTHAGLKNFLMHNGNFTGLLHVLTGSKFMGDDTKALHSDIHAQGIGLNNVHKLHAFEHNPYEHDDILTGNSHYPVLDTLSRGMETVNRALMSVSRLEPLLGHQQTSAAAAIAQKFYDMARRMQKAKEAGNDAYVPQNWKNRLAHMNISEDMHDRIGQQLIEHTPTKQTILGEKIKGLNLDAWTDHEAKAHFVDGMFRMSRKMVQSTDMSSRSLFMSQAAIKFLTQFKSFVMQAWSNHTLYGLNNWRDPNQVLGIAMGTAMAGSLVYLHSLIKNGLDQNNEEFKKETTPTRLALSAFQRAGFSSILPNIIDTFVPALTGTKAFFDNRASGNASTFIAPAAAQQYGTIYQSLGELARTAGTNTRMSQQGIKGLIMNIPGASFAPVQGAINYGLKHSSNFQSRSVFPPKPPCGEQAVTATVHRLLGN